MNTALKISNLAKIYKNGVQALKQISFSVEQGDFFALLGPNGAGKSTTLGIISSTVVKSSGSVSIMGYDLERDPFNAKRYLGVMPQEINLNIFETPLQILVTQANYYGMPRKLALTRAEMLLNKLALWDKRDQQTRMLSGGMKRRLMIARALIHDPRMVILDEPTAGVDVELRKLMWDFFVELNREGLTVILTTHYLEEAENLCRNLAIINQGEIVRLDTMQRLMHELEQETLILHVASALETAPHLPWDLKLLDAHQLAVSVKKGQSLNELFVALTAHHIKVVSMRNESNRLEQLFMKLVKEHRHD
jgi:ABC-2 type transport system ATP-binding protein